MPPKPSLNMFAGSSRRAAARGHDAGQRRNPVDQAQDLSRDVDQLLRLESIECRSAAALEEKVALVERIADAACGLREHYRGPSSRPCRAPAYVSPDGRTAVW